MDLTQIILWIVLPLLYGAWTICCLHVGFRMGRQSIDKPLAPIIKPKQIATVEEDPWWEPMHGSPRESVPTIKER